MKILLLHCDYIKFRPVKKALKNIELEEVSEEWTNVKEVLVVFIAVESKDTKKDEIVKKLCEEIREIAKQVNTKNIVLYPYAHLSSDLAPPELAQEILIEAEKNLKDFNVVRAPFGYYKEFELKCKGHPLAELSREIKIETSLSEEIEIKEETIKRLLKEVTRHKLDTSKLKENDHRIIGEQLDLFSFHDCAPGMVFWHNKGWIIFQELLKFWRELHKEAGYQEVSTPLILDKKLWLISGHWEKYRENIFLTKYEKRDFAIKPMNCPGGILIYKSSPKSYKDLPLRVAEIGIVHRQELSGVLAGLFRVIKITQDDAHIYCTEEQLENEIVNIIKLIEKVYKKFNFSYEIELSTRPQKRIGSDEMWDKAENTLKNVLEKNKIKYKINEGEGAFYGPKIDFHIKDSLGRSWQCATIQIDFAMPERFDLTYKGKDNKEYRPIMIHRTVLGSFERFIGILLEHLNGKLPVWLSPIQVRVLSFTERNIKFATKVYEKLRKEGIRCDLDIENETIDYKIREAELQKIPYMIVVGDKEEKNKTIAVRERGKKPQFNVKIGDFIKKIKKEIEERI